jgi:hypothetical protein
MTLTAIENVKGRPAHFAVHFEKRVNQVVDFVGLMSIRPAMVRCRTV